MKNDLIEIKPHSWIENEESYSADCYPFVEGKPEPKLADCCNCFKYREGADYCDEWKDKPEDAPLFCGPICPEFEIDK